MSNKSCKAVFGDGEGQCDVPIDNFRNNMLVGLSRFEICTLSGDSLRILAIDIGVSLMLPR